jgi:hypothetical protein
VCVPASALQILLIRSLYSYVRVLPAYRMYRACKRHGGELFNTSYTLSTTADPSMQPMHPWPQQQQQAQRSAAHAGGGPSSSSSSGPQGGRMCHFAFSPVETLGGSFSIHVDYQPATTVHILEVSSSPLLTWLPFSLVLSCKQSPAVRCLLHWLYMLRPSCSNAKEGSAWLFMY